MTIIKSSLLTLPKLKPSLHLALLVGLSLGLGACQLNSSAPKPNSNNSPSLYQASHPTKSYTLGSISYTTPPNFIRGDYDKTRAEFVVPHNNSVLIYYKIELDRILSPQKLQYTIDYIRKHPQYPLTDRRKAQQFLGIMQPRLTTIAHTRVVTLGTDTPTTDKYNYHFYNKQNTPHYGLVIQFNDLSHSIQDQRLYFLDKNNQIIRVEIINGHNPKQLMTEVIKGIRF